MPIVPPVSQLAHVIDEYIHSERDRAIAKRRMIDGISIEDLAEEFDRTSRAMQTKVTKLQSIVYAHLQ